MKGFILLLLGICMSAFSQGPLKVSVLEFTNAVPEDEDRVKRGIEIIERVVNSPEFKNKVRSMNYQVGKYSYKGYSQTNLNSSQVLETIFKAKENFSGGQDGQIDVFLDMYYENSDVIGYTDTDDKFVHMNRFFHQHYSASEVARNIFHEWLHKINHDHSYEYNAYRPHSVPYKLGQLVMDMASTIESKGDPLLKNLIMDSQYECSH